MSKNIRLYKRGDMNKAISLYRDSVLSYVKILQKDGLSLSEHFDKNEIELTTQELELLNGLVGSLARIIMRHGI